MQTQTTDYCLIAPRERRKISSFVSQADGGSREAAAAAVALNILSFIRGRKLRRRKKAICLLIKKLAQLMRMYLPTTSMCKYIPMLVSTLPAGGLNGSR